MKVNNVKLSAVLVKNLGIYKHVKYNTEKN